MLHWLSSLGFALLLSAAAAAQPVVTEAEEAAIDAADKAQRQGQYLAAIELLRPVAFDAEGNPTSGFAHDQWAEAVTLVTGEQPPRAPSARAADPDAIAAIEAATPRDAIAEIVARARETSIVFLNEDHGVPRSRAFGLQLAEALRPLGYSVLAVETLTNDADLGAIDARLAAIQADGYVRRDSGYYLRDPVFADFLRQAMALGYRLAAYEQTPDLSGNDPELGIPKREQAQADYLLNRVLDRNPGAKILVYVGFSHATETPRRRENGEAQSWLAARVKAMTGIDPLTIDQACLMRGGMLPTPQALVEAATARADEGRSIVLMRAGGAPLVVGQYAGLVDLQVVHPDLPRDHGRPGWIAPTMHRTPAPVPADLAPESGTRLIQAFIASEGENAIPVDQFLVKASEPMPMGLLPDVPIRWTTQDGVAGD